MEIININIKILNDKYEIFLDKVVYKSIYITTYLGKNITNNTKILVDIYIKNIQILAKKIINKIVIFNNKNIVKIDDIIIEKNIVYLIKKYYKKKFKEIKINKYDFLYYFEEIISSFEYLHNKNIEIENLNPEQIFFDNNKIIILPYFENNIYPLNVVYGSPIFDTENINGKNKIENENKIINNICILYSKLLKFFFNIDLDIDIDIDIEINSSKKDNDKYEYDLYDIYLNINCKQKTLRDIIDYIKNLLKTNSKNIKNEKNDTYEKNNENLVFDFDL